MKAIRFRRYGSPDVLELQDVDEPTIKDDELLVRIRAACVNRYDWHLMTGVPYIGRVRTGLIKPKVGGLGADLAGRVESVGKAVTRFRPGDEVFGQVNGEVPGQPLLELGSFAEYVGVSEGSVAPRPANLTFEQAAAAPMAARTALQGLRDQGQIRPGQSVLINGASGGVGTFAVQIAKSFGVEVTGVCSTRNVEMVRSLGADEVIDYTRRDFTTVGHRYDLLMDNVGNHSPSECRRVLKPNGVYVASFGRPDHRWLGPLVQLVHTMALSQMASQRMVAFVSNRNEEALLDVKELLEAGEMTPVIDRAYPLAEVPDALRYLEDGHARGKIVVTV